MENYDVIVIGSGIGGLTAALDCAKAGRRVLVLEAAKQFGGFINPFCRKKFWFDSGIHYIGDMGPGRSLHRQFERLGILDKVTFRELTPEGFDRYVFPDYETVMCKGLDNWRESLIRDFPAEASGLRRFFELLREVDLTMRVASKVQGPLSAIKLLPRVPTLLRYYKATFSQILERFVTDVRLKAALAGPGGDVGLPPGKASGLIMLGVLAHFLGGAHFPEGGCKGVRDAYLELLEAQGATLKRNRPVEKLLTSGNRVTGVRTRSGETYSAPVVISNAGAIPTLRDLVGTEHLSRRLRRKVDAAKYSLGSLCVFVGTDQQPQAHGLTDANIWHYPSYDIDSLYEPALNGQLSDDLPFFMTVPTLKDPSGHHAPAGKHTVELITFAPWKPFEQWKDQPTLKRDAEYQALKERIGRRLLERAERYFPKLSQHAEVFEVATPLTNTSYVNVTAGSIYGLDHTPEQIGPGRFPTTGPIDGLFLCGADVMGAGISTCVSSGSLAARQALRYQTTPLWNRVRAMFGSPSAASPDVAQP